MSYQNNINQIIDNFQSNYSLLTNEQRQFLNNTYKFISNINTNQLELLISFHQFLNNNNNNNEKKCYCIDGNHDHNHSTNNNNFLLNNPQLYSASRNTYNNNNNNYSNNQIIAEEHSYKSNELLNHINQDPRYHMYNAQNEVSLYDKYNNSQYNTGFNDQFNNSFNNTFSQQHNEQFISQYSNQFKDFIPSEQYRGRIQGYKFQNNYKGLGYYIDPKQK